VHDRIVWGVVEVLQGGVAVEGVDHGQAVVARAGAVVAIGFEVGGKAPIGGASSSSKSSWNGCLPVCS